MIISKQQLYKLYFIIDWIYQDNKQFIDLRKLRQIQLTGDNNFGFQPLKKKCSKLFKKSKLI